MAGVATQAFRWDQPAHTDAWLDEAILALNGELSMVEHGLAVVRDPLFFAYSVFVKRPQRIMAVAFVMTRCLLVYKFAEALLRQRLAQTGQTVPDHKRRAGRQH
jgi:transposase